MNKQKPVIRDATVNDLKGMIILAEKLIGHEEGLSNISLINDMAQRRSEVTKSIAEALVSPDHKVLVIEKSGMLLGLFIAYVENISKIFRKNKVCNWWIAINPKPTIYTPKIVKKMTEWAKLKNCDVVRIHVLIENKRATKLIELMKFKEIFATYEKEVA